MHVEAVVGERTLFLDARPPATLNLNREGAPHALFFPAHLRPSTLLARTDSAATRAIGVVRDETSTDGGLSLIRSMAGLIRARVKDHVILIEEPELYLTPPAQRHLHRLLRRLAARGRNQVMYSTHAPVFLGVDRLDELVLVRHDERTGTTLLQPKALSEQRTFRLVSELDAERAEIFLSRAVLLVEGRTEKLVFPLIFQALGLDADQEAIAVIDCAGQGQHPAVRGDLQRLRDPVRRRPRPGRAPRVDARRGRAGRERDDPPRRREAPHRDARPRLRRSHGPARAARQARGGLEALPDRRRRGPGPLRQAVERVVAAARRAPRTTRGA